MDGLRALAALCVFAVHYNQMVKLDFKAGPFDMKTFMANGNHGVALFFLLSGFLLSLPFWQALMTGHPYPGIKKYFSRRIVRIVPAYYLILTVLILVTNYWKIPGIGFDIISHYLFIFNFTEFTIFSISPQFWTLAVELQFYLLLPLFFMGLRSDWVRKHIPLVIGLLIVAACSAQYVMIQVFDRIISWPFNPWLTWVRPYGAVLNHSLLASLPHFLLGMTAGYIYQKIHLRSNGVHWLKAHGEYLFWAGLISILILLSTGWINSIEISFCPYGMPLVPILLILIIIAAPMTRFALKILESRGIRNLGIISYGIYLYHYPCLLYIEHYMRIRNLDVEIHWLIFGSVSLAASMITATISYFAVERPFLRLVRGK